MTLAEVIDTLQTWIEKADDEYDSEEMGRVAGLKEALHEIKKIEPCTDAISRQAVIDLPRIKTHNQWGNVIKESVDIEDVRQLPPVTPAEKVGRWIPDRCDMYTCSKCNHTYTDLIGERYGMNFCPNCGSRMIQEVEE